MQVIPCNGMDYLLPPTPPHSPRPASKKPCTERKPPPRIPCNISLTTIAEEPSHFSSSSSDSKISVHVHPEVLVQTPSPGGTTTTTFMDRGGRNKSYCDGRNKSYCDGHVGSLSSYLLSYSNTIFID